MPTIDVDVTFRGSLRVRVPGRIPNNKASILAQKIALARVQAACNAESAESEEVAFEEFRKEAKLPKGEAEKAYDKAVAEGVGGTWSIGETSVVRTVPSPQKRSKKS